MSAIKFNETADYQHIRVQGIAGVYTPSRIQNNTLPAGFYPYSFLPADAPVLADAAAQDIPNNAGSLITKEKLSLENIASSDRIDWSFEDRPFDFEAYFGCKLAFDTQVELAEAKRDAQAAEKKQTKHRDNSHSLDAEDMDI